MAINRDDIVSGYMKGNGQSYYWPFMQSDDPDDYVGLDQLPASTQAQFTYDPVKAKQLLADAGYSSLTISPIVQNSMGTPERAELLASYWSKIGVTTNFQMLDDSSFRGQRDNGKFVGMVCTQHGAPTTLDMLSYFTTNADQNFGNSDPTLDQMYKDVLTTTDPAQRIQKTQKAAEQLLADNWAFAFPAEDNYNFWTPRVQNYNGLSSLSMYNYGSVYKYLWLSSK